MSASESAENSIGRGVIQSEKDIRCFSLAEIQLATNNFNDGLVIGIGGFGKVYKGLIDDGATTVAIKRLNQEAQQGAEEFWTEVNMLSKLHHTNLVSLIGQYNEGQDMILVYEYISHGTLAEHLHKKRKKQRDTSTTSISQYLTWEQRLIICIGAARGLDYLHNLGIIHRDVKTTNILLDDNWGAKISDFGLSKITKTHSITHVTTNVKGTFGYLDPEYYLTRRLTKKSDVYAFGVVLFEVLCGRPALDHKLEDDQINLARWAQECNKKGKLDQIIDPSLSGEIAPRCLKSFGKVANNCLRPSPKERPTMATVVHSLELALASQRKGSGTNGIIDKFVQLGMNRYWKKDSKTSTGTSNYGGAAPITVAPPWGTIETLPMFRDVSVPERQNLFVRKVQICCFQFDFSDTLKMVREKEIKRQCLLELVDFVQPGSGIITESNQEEMVRMISVNIFRCLPPASLENTSLEYVNLKDEEAVELEPYLEPGWHHLQLVYELLLRYVVSSNTGTKVAKRYIDHSFLLKLLELFDSEDPREREYLKTILHQIYGRFMVHRLFIRKAINNIFYRFIYETERHSGIGVLLEVLGSIINGFVLPIFEEHKLFLVRALIPLHKPKSIALYHQQLSYCITQFVEKDYKLADRVIWGLLTYWPVTNCQKEVLFIGELQEVLEATQAAEFQRCTVPLFRQIACCLKSPHFQVAERALSLWKNEHIVNLIAQNLSVVVPIVFEALEKNIQTHWNQAVHGLTVNVRKMFIDMDIELFEECRRQYEEKEAGAQEREQRRELTWQRLDAAAANGGRGVANMV